jgi:hypothetical protein
MLADGTFLTAAMLAEILGFTPVALTEANITTALGSAAVKADGSVKFTGAPIITVNAAPADGTLAATDCALWFDATDGAAKLMAKAKQANGTVKTGAVDVAT